ncbi:MAG: DUF86 domain-containing protein [Candidatus Lokiarchaeota archaeon]|nr:DUF86 domain-containing protein [Candidatus Lokiarchaeota archaeon]MBD3202196.1 DUF86 domain-containing protein [Candidatus Lokiarchaeota archaeon]
MDKDRLKRYKEKLEYLDKTIKHLRDWTLNVEENEFTNEVELQKRYSIYHAFQILVEIVSDLAAILLKDENIIPKDGYSNLDVLNEKEIINFEIYKN